MRAALLVVLALAAAPAGAFERLGVVAVADPPAGPDADLAELAHQLRAACRDRVGGVEDVPTMRARLLGRTSNATLSELDRAYGGALAVYQNGEFESALRTLHAIVEDLERLPETDDGYAQWVRAQLRLAHAALTIGRDAEADAALYALARTDLRVTADPDLYSPSYRRRFEGIKAKVRALPARRLTVIAEGRAGTVYVNGRPMGTTPLSLWLPAGAYRIGGAVDGLRVPGFRLDLEAEDRSVVLDFALAGSLRVNAGPGLALPAARRGDGIIRAGAWLGVDRVVAVSRAHEGDAAFLLGSIYDVRRGALLREGSVRMVAGSVPAANLGALAAFLLTGQSSRDVKDRTDTARERTVVAAAQIVEAPNAVLAAQRSPEPVAAIAPTFATSPAAEPAARASAAPPAPPAGGPAAASVKRSSGQGSAAAGAASPAAASAAAPSAASAGKPGLAAAPPASIAPGPARPALALAPGPEDLPPPYSPVVHAGARRGRDWLRRATIGSVVVAVGLAGLAVQQGVAARDAYSDADAMLSGGVFRPGTSAADVSRYRALQEDGDGARRNAYLSAGAAAAFAAAAGVLGWRSMDRAPVGPAGEPVLALRF